MKSTVVIARSEKLKRRGFKLSKENTRRYIDKALVKLTGKGSAAAAWEALFSPREKVGIKLSCLPGRHLSSAEGLVMAIVDALLEAGIEGRNIYVWERTNRELDKAGFIVGRSKINILGTDSFPGGGYSKNIEFAGSVGTCFSKIMGKVDAMINVPVLKDHDIAGVSIGMKNFFGAIYNPNKFHSNNCDPYVADLCTHPLIKNKLRLIVCDASRIQVNNGPAFYPKYALEYGALLVGRDPVALDYTGWQIIEEGRKQLKLKSLKESGREPRYIFTAAKLKLGQADPQKIKIVNI
ncbi:MAG: DUF362 domain-containing protein [Candidatus Aminicenantes bacterium]|nr:DUF362 domain-containing protein [Candidatus Aminicenantes bacterium]